MDANILCLQVGVSGRTQKSLPELSASIMLSLAAAHLNLEATLSLFGYLGDFSLLPSSSDEDSSESPSFLCLALKLRLIALCGVRLNRSYLSKEISFSIALAALLYLSTGDTSLRRSSLSIFSRTVYNLF